MSIQKLKVDRQGLLVQASTLFIPSYKKFFFNYQKCFFFTDLVLME